MDLEWLCDHKCYTSATVLWDMERFVGKHMAHRDEVSRKFFLFCLLFLVDASFY